MKKIIAGLILGLSISSNANVVCNFAESTMEVATEAFAKTFKCENQEAIFEDMMTITKINSLCSKDQEELRVQSVTCRLIARNAAIYVTSKIPTNWECDKDTSEDLLEVFAYKTCKTIQDQIQ